MPAWGRGYRARGRMEAGPRRWHRARGGASVPRGGRRPAGWLAGPHWCGERAVRPVERYGRFSGLWRRRCGSCPLLQHVWLRLRLGTGDQNALGGADAAAPGFSGTAAPGPRVRGPRWRLPLFPGPARRGGRRRCPAFRERGDGAAGLAWGPGAGRPWARVEAPEPSRCVVRPRWPDSPGAAASAQGGPAAGRWDPCGVPWLLEPRRLQLRSPPPPLSASQARPGRWTQAGTLQFASHSGMFPKAFVPFPGPCVGSPNSHPLWPPVLSLPATCLPTSVYLDSAD